MIGDELNYWECPRCSEELDMRQDGLDEDGLLICRICRWEAELNEGGN